jgi:hypothetical protein
MMAYIVQCELRSGKHVTMTWLPERYAIAGGSVTLRDDPKDVDGRGSLSADRRG